MTALLTVTDLAAGYDGALALRGVSLHVQAGETVAIVGANGAGKTTLVRSIAGMVSAARGTVQFDGREIGGLRTDQICEAGLAHVPEGRQLFAGLSVEDNLRLGGALRRARAATGEALAQVFDLFPRLAERRRQLAGTLSGGEQQMVAIGRALMARPLLMMMDEPSLGLSPLMVETMFDTIGALNRQGMSILLIEQNVVESLMVATRGYVLEDGAITMQGDAAALRVDDGVRKAYLGI